ncbi:Transcription factor [Penicillium robsamsonii]|uniref:Transcription factor n=1 Tax=Penicillium robsamsonii TaxID=1792511 RepID=UPI002547CE3C|nr:Transcription factor [Penicillium robsamsonii]KAJ5811041.1 Transcription factor [Penicillium robsamsonii]
MASNSPDIETPSGRPPKRRRVAIACDACRTRKSRCDGKRPSCSLCQDLGFECVYTPPPTAANVIVQKDYLHGLEDRVKRLEESFGAVRGDLDGLFKRVDRGPERGRDRESAISGRNASENHNEMRIAAPMPGLIGTEDSVDGMGAVIFADEEDSGFFGPSSNIAFLRHLSGAIVQPGYFPSPSAAEGGFVNASRPSSPLRQTGQDQRIQVNIFALPPQANTLELIERYFSNTGLLFPYIYPPVFQDTYHQVTRENFSRVRRTWLGLLNMVLAMATITAIPGSASADARIEESDVFYQRGLGLCGSEILRGTTLEVGKWPSTLAVFQYLLLMGQYLQGTQKSIQAWTVHGLAVKAALQLGLHSRHASKVFSPIEQEMRKRTWYGCVVLDRTLSMTFGRPAAIPDSYVKLELPTKREFENSTGLVDDETAALSVAFFNSTIGLYKQLWNILELLYGQNIGCDGPLPVSETVAHIFSLEQHLFSWERSLIHPLQLISSASIDELPHDQMSSNSQYLSLRFQVILTLRYLNLRVLLHRPILVKFITASRSPDRDPQDMRLLQQIGINSLQICADSAMEIIDIVHRVVSEPGWKRNLLGAWWFSLYYTFNAALVLIGVGWVYRDTSLTNSSMTDQASKARQYPGRAVAALSRLDEGNRLIDRCRYYLEQFSKVLNDFETNFDASTTALPALHATRAGLAGDDFSLSPFGMELGEFMMDGDLVAMIDRQGLLPADPNSAFAT